MIDEAREERLRRWAAEYGLELHKREGADPTVQEEGGYMLVDAEGGYVVRGYHCSYSLDDVERYLTYEVEG